MFDISPKKCLVVYSTSLFAQSIFNLNVDNSATCGITIFLLSENRITKTRRYNFDPLQPHFYIVKLGFTGYVLFFLFLLKNIDCGTR